MSRPVRRTRALLVALMEPVAIAAHVPRQVAVAIRVRTAAVADIQRRAAVDIQVPIVAVADIQLRATAAVADTQLHVAVVAAAAAAAGIQLPVAAEVEVGSTPPEATTGLITDDKNFELLPGGPPSRPFLFLETKNLNSGALLLRSSCLKYPYFHG